VTAAKEEKRARVVEKTRFRVFLDESTDLGFTIFATLNAILLLLQLFGRVMAARPIWILALLGWCPFFWGQYVVARSEARWTQWILLGCAIAYTAAIVLTIIVFLNRTARVIPGT